MPALLALLALLAPPAVHAAAPDDLFFERIGRESGPPPQVITALYQDRAGFLWIGSRGGLLLFDGYDFTVFTHDASDASSISDNAIRTIYEDSHGDLWIGTNTGGLNRMDRATWEFEQFRHDSADPRTLSHDSVNAIVEDGDGALWVGTQVGLNRFDRETGLFEHHMADPGNPGSLSHDYVYALHQDRDGSLWVGTVGGGLNLWDPDSGVFTSFRNDPGDPSSLSDDIVFAITEDGTGGLWVGTNAGLNRMDRGSGTFRRFLHDPADDTSLSYALVTSLAPGPPGKLWVGTHSGGLNQLDVETGAFRAWRHDPGRGSSLGSDQLICLLTDNAGALWIGTWGGGLSRLTTSTLLLSTLAGHARMPEESESVNVTALADDDRGGIWIGTRSGDLVRRDPALRSDRFYSKGQEHETASILELREDRGGRVWAGTSNGLRRVDPRTGELSSYHHDPGDPGSIGPGYVKAILPEREDRLWVGTGEGGLNLVDGDGRVLRRFANDPADPESLGDNYVTSLVEDRQGTLWVGTRSGGLNALDPETGRAIRFQPAPSDDSTISHHYVTSIAEDSAGRLWVGTGGGGLNRVDRSDDGTVLRFTRFTERDGLIDNDVMAILEAEDGSLWLSTRRGLSRFDPAGGSFSSLYVSDGLPSGEFEPGAAARAGNTLYFGSVKGIAAIPGDAPFPAPQSSPTVITAIHTASGRLTGDRPAWELEELEVPYGTWLSFQFAVMDYSTEHMHRYAYSLDGGEDDWVDLGARREITFTDLDPKVHELRVRGRNSQGVWNTAAPMLRIRVVPPFWMTFWFRGLVLLGIGALTIGWHQARMSALEKRNRELWELTEQRERARKDLRDAYERLRGLTRRLEVAKEEERKRIARELHDDMGPSLTAVIINLQLLSDDSDAGATARRRTDTIDLVDRMIERIRDLSLDLRPPLIDELGLVPALSGYLEGQAERTGIDIQLSEDSAAEGLPPELEITAFRVVQEAVTNVIRHSRAKRADVVVRRREGRLELIVRDEGRGFNVGDTMERAATGKALGLLGMQERVSMLDGEVAIESTPGKGTVIRASMPVGGQP